VTSLSGVGKRYGRGSMIIANVDLEIEPGTPLVVLGANGSGKSTLLRIIAGCAAPTRDRVAGRPPWVTCRTGSPHWLPPVGVAAKTLADTTLGLALAAAATTTTLLAHNRR